jgi:uncharacterized protein YkwD
MPNARRPSFQPRVECLEDRTLMASHLTATLEGGLLRIVGTNGNDRIVVGQQNNHISVEGIVIHVRGRSPVKSVNARDVSRIQVLGLGGDDTIILGGSARRGPDALVKPTIVWGGPGKDRIWGDMGRNTIYGQQGNDQIWSRSGHDTIDGGSGRDIVWVVGGAAHPAPGHPLGSTFLNDEKIVSVSSASPPQFAVQRTATVSFQAEVARLVEMINAYRVSHGLTALAVDWRLVEAAQYQASYMARTGDYSHVDLDGRTVGDRVLATGYSFAFVGECIHLYDPAIPRTEGINHIYPRSELVNYFLDGWKVSPDHNAILLSPEPRQIGIAFAQDGARRIYADAVFGLT